MSVRMRYLVVAAVVLGLLSVPALLTAQQTPAYGREEWNDYQAAKGAPTLDEKVQGYQAFLNKYPDSVLRAYIYPEMIALFYGAQKREQVLDTIEAYLTVDKQVFLKAGFTEFQYDANMYDQHRQYVYVVREVLGTGGNLDDARTSAAVRHARVGLDRLAGFIQSQRDVGGDAAQLEAARSEYELLYRQVLATLTWRQQDYDAALPELAYLMDLYPDQANLALQMGYSYLNKSKPDTLKGIWYLARAVGLGHPQAETAQRTILSRIVRHTGVVPSCMQSDIDAVYEKAAGQVHPPAGWSLVSNDQINAARQGITYAGLFDILATGDENAHVAWLAACGIPFGLGDDGTPTYEAVLLSYEEVELAAEEAESMEGEEAPAQALDAGAAAGPKKAVILRVAATPAAVSANTPNLEIVVRDFSNLAKLREETNQTIKIGGTITSFKADPFILRLKEGKVAFLEAVFDEQ